MAPIKMRTRKVRHKSMHVRRFILSMAFFNINTRALEAQLEKAIDDDVKRKNINSAKLRAMTQAVPYDEFKQLVIDLDYHKRLGRRFLIGCWSESQTT